MLAEIPAAAVVGLAHLEVGGFVVQVAVGLPMRHRQQMAAVTVPGPDVAAEGTIAVLPPAGVQPRLRTLRPARDQVDGAAGGAGPVGRRTRSLQDLDALQVLHRHRQIHGVMARLRIPHAHAVHHQQGLLEGRAANADVGLDAAPAALPHVHAADVVEKVGDVVRSGTPDLVPADQAHRLIQLFQRPGDGAGGDHQGVRSPGGIGLRTRHRGQQGEDGGEQRHREYATDRITGRERPPNRQDVRNGCRHAEYLEARQGT